MSDETHRGREMPTDMQREIKELLTQLVTQRDEGARELREQLGKVTERIGDMDAKITKLTARDDTVTEMRTTQQTLRDDVIKLKTQMTVVGAVAVALLVAVVTLIFQVFSGAS